MKTALVVIDVQSYFLDGSPADLPEKIAKHIRSSDYDCVMFTVFNNPDESNYERSLHWTKCKSEEDKKLPDEFKDLATEKNTFEKSTYSAFKVADFEEYLQKNEIQRLELCGIDSDACVLATAYEAFDKGYEVKILFDLSYSRYDFQEVVKKIAEKNIQTKNWL